MNPEGTERRLAAILSATKAVADSGEELKGDLVVAAVCDEEYASIGTERLVEQVRADAAVVGSPQSSRFWSLTKASPGSTSRPTGSRLTVAPGRWGWTP